MHRISGWPDIPAFFDIRYPAAGYSAGYPVIKKAGYPAGYPAKYSANEKLLNTAYNIL